MDTWQRDHIRKNLTRLLRYTICSNILLATLEERRVLGPEDLDDIKSERKELDKVRRLYDIIKTRTDGYAKLVQALLLSGQSGAAEILLKNIPLEKLSSATELGNYFTNKISHVADNSFQMRDMSTHADSVDKHWSELSCEALSNLVKQTIPDPIPYYIPRNIYSRRVNINPVVFTINCSDVFVFKCIKRLKLIDLVNNQPTHLSSSQLLDVTARFILLEEDLDWTEIKKRCKYPAHLVRFDTKTGTCFLEDTTAGSKVIHQFLSYKNEKNGISISEEAFIETVIQSPGNGACICDYPGMGKSLLLANLARKVAETHPEKIVAFIRLPQFADAMRKENEKSNLSTIDLVISYISQSVTAQHVLKGFIDSKSVQMELFFDGFDEVQQKHAESVKSVLKHMSQLENSRIYVTSRLHTRHELESIFGVLAYDIQPFHEENQIQFLQTHWMMRDPTCNPDKLESYAKHSLGILKQGLTQNEQNITGIPLQCRILAEINAQAACIFAQPRRVSQIPNPETVGSFLPEMYQKYVALHLGETECDYSCLVLGKDSNCSSQCKIISMHVWLALKTIHPELAELVKVYIKVVVTKSSYFAKGILHKNYILNQNSSMSVEFLHRTFAEYLVADLVAQIFYSYSKKQPGKWKRMKTRVVNCEMLNSPLHNWKKFKNIVVDLSIKILLQTTWRCQLWIGHPSSELTEVNFADINQPFEQPVFAYFLEKCLQFHISANGNLLNFPVTSYLPRNEFASLLVASLRLDYGNIFELISGTILSNTLLISWKYTSYFTIEENSKRAILLTLTASKFSDTKLIEKLFQEFEKYFQVDLGSIISQIHTEHITPIHIAIERNSYEIMQYFLGRVFLVGWITGRDFLNSCVSKTEDGGYEIDRNRIEICKLLLRKYQPENKNEIRVVDLLKFLVQLGANLYHTYTFINNETTVTVALAHLLLDYLSTDDFDQLCSFLKSQFVNFQRGLKTKNCISILCYVLYISKVEITSLRLEKIMKTLELDVNEIDDLGQNEFLRSVADNRETTGLIWLYKLKSNCFLTTNFKETSLHLAASNGNLETAQLLLEIGLSVNARERFGCTPLHYAAIHGKLEMFKLLVAEGADIYSTDEDGNTCVHFAAKRFDEEEQFHQFVEFVVGLGETCSLSQPRNNDGHTPLQGRYIREHKTLSKTLDLIATNK